MTDDTLTAAVARLKLDCDCNIVGPLQTDIRTVLAALEAAQAGAVRVNRDKPKINEGGQAPCESPDRCTGAQVNADEAAHARTDGDESVTQTVPPSPDAMI